MVLYTKCQWSNQRASQHEPRDRRFHIISLPTDKSFVSVARTNMAPIIWSTEFLPKIIFSLQILVHVFAFRMRRFLVSLISNIRERISLPDSKEGIAVLPRGARCVWSRQPAYLHGSLYIAWKAARFPKLRVLLLYLPHTITVPQPKAQTVWHFIGHTVWVGTSRKLHQWFQTTHSVIVELLFPASTQKLF
jgi:hypothetical protein